MGHKILIFVEKYNPVTLNKQVHCSTGFKGSQNWFYYIEISNHMKTSIYITFPSKKLPWAVTHFCQRSERFWKRSWQPFLILLSMLSSLLQRLPWCLQIFILSEHFEKKSGSDKSELWWMIQSCHIMTTNAQCAGALSCRRN
jgi:hypothetical protein